MPEVKLTAEEADVLRHVLASLAIKTRTGELGILHGMDRFVSTQRIFKKAERKVLDDAARKLGLSGGVKQYI
jgi:F0F1-type ATP synthase epsilon subunit